MSEYKRHTPFTFVWSDSIIEGDIIPVQHRGDLLQSMYLTLSDNGVIQPWDPLIIHSIEWYIGQTLIDTYYIDMPRAPKTFSEYQYTVDTSPLFCPIQFSFPVPIVCLQYDKMYFKVNFAKTTSYRILCHMSFVTLSDEERRDIAMNPYFLHIQKHHLISDPTNFYIHAPIKYITSSLFKISTRDDFHLVVNGQKTSEPVASIYHSPYIGPSPVFEGEFPPRKLTQSAETINGGIYTIKVSSVHGGTNPWDDVWQTSSLVTDVQSVTTSASSNTIYAWKSTNSDGWISDDKLFGGTKTYKIESTSNVENAWKSTIDVGWKSDASYGNVTTQNANVIAGSNVTNAWKIVSAPDQSWIPNTVYASDKAGQYTVEVSTGLLSQPNVWKSSNTFGYQLTTGDYSVSATSNTDNAWKVLDVDPKSYWRSGDAFGQQLYTIQMTSNNASSNLSSTLTQDRLFDVNTESGWSSNSNSNVYGFGLNPGVYMTSSNPDAPDSWKAFDGDDDTYWQSIEDFKAGGITKLVSMSASSNLADAWKVSDYNEGTAWRSGQMNYGRRVTPRQPPSVSSGIFNAGQWNTTGSLFGNTISAPQSFSATSNTTNVSNAISWSRNLSWRSDATFGQVILPSGSYPVSTAPTTNYSNDTTVSTLSQATNGYTGFAAWTPPLSNIFCSNPIPGRYESNVSGVFDTNQIIERFIATVLPSTASSQSFTLSPGSSTYIQQNATGIPPSTTVNIPNYFKKYPFDQVYTDTNYRAVFSSTGLFISPSPSFSITNGQMTGTAPIYTFSGYSTSNISKLTHQVAVFSGSQMVSGYISCTNLTNDSIRYSLPDIQSSIDTATIQVNYSNPNINSQVVVVPGAIYSNSMTVLISAESTLVNPSQIFSGGSYVTNPNGFTLRLEQSIGTGLPIVYPHISNFFYELVQPPNDDLISLSGYEAKSSNVSYQMNYLATSRLSSDTKNDPTGSLVTTVTPSGLIGLFPFRCLAFRSPILWALPGRLNILEYGIPYDGIPSGFVPITCGKYLIAYYGSFANPTNTQFNIYTYNDPSGTWNLGPYISSSQYIYAMKPTVIYTSKKFNFFGTQTNCTFINGKPKDPFDGYIQFISGTFPINDNTITYLQIDERTYFKIQRMRRNISTNRCTIYGNFVNIYDTKISIPSLGSNFSFNYGYVDTTNFNFIPTILSYNSIQLEIQEPTGEVFFDSQQMIITGTNTTCTLYIYEDNNSLISQQTFECGSNPVTIYNKFNIRAQGNLIIKLVYDVNRTLIIVFEETTRRIMIYSSDTLSVPEQYQHIVPYNSYLRFPLGRLHIFRNLRNLKFDVSAPSVTYEGYTFTPSYYYINDNYTFENLPLTSRSDQKLYTTFCTPWFQFPFNFIEYSGDNIYYVASDKFQTDIDIIHPRPIFSIDINQDKSFISNVNQRFRVCDISTTDVITPVTTNIPGFTKSILYKRFNPETNISSESTSPGAHDEYCMRINVPDGSTVDIPFIKVYIVDRFYFQISHRNFFQSIENFNGPVSAGPLVRYTFNTRWAPIYNPGSQVQFTVSSPSSASAFNRVDFIFDGNVDINSLTQFTIGGVNRRNLISSSGSGSRYTVSTSDLNTVNYSLTFISTSVGTNINRRISRIEFYDSLNQLVDSFNLDTSASSASVKYRYLSTLNLTLYGRIQGLSVVNPNDFYTINFNNQTISGGTDNNVGLGGRFQNTSTNWSFTIDSLTTPTVSSLGYGETITSFTSGSGNIFTTYNLSGIPYYSRSATSTIPIIYTLAPVSNNPIQLNFPRSLTYNKIIIGSSYASGFNITGFTKNGNIYTSGTPVNSSSVIITPVNPSVRTSLTISNIVVYNDSSRVSPSIPGTILTIRCGGIKMARGDGTIIYPNHSMEDSHSIIRPLPTGDVIFTMNVHSNIGSVNSLLLIVPAADSVSPVYVPDLSSSSIKNEFELTFRIRSYNGQNIIINNNLLVGNVFSGGKNTSNVLITLPSARPYNGYVSYVAPTTYLVHRMCGGATTTNADQGTSYDEYNFFVTESDVYSPTIYFKLRSTSGIELHKDLNDTSTTGGPYPIGVYTINCDPSVFTSQGSSVPVSGPITIIYPAPVPVTRVVINGTGTSISPSIPTSSSQTTFTITGTSITRVLFFNGFGLVTPRLINRISGTNMYWVSNTISSNVLVTPTTFGTTVPSIMNITGYRLTTTATRLPSNISIINGSTTLDIFRNTYPVTSYSCVFPVPKTVSGSIQASVNELMELDTVSGCSLTLYAYSSTVPSTSLSSPIYGIPTTFCQMSGSSYVSAIRGILNTTNPGSDTMVIDFGSNVVNISRITFSNIVTTLNTPGLLYVSPTNCFVSGQVTPTTDGGSYNGSMRYLGTGNIPFAEYMIGSAFTPVSIQPSIQQTFLGSPDIYPYSNVSRELGGTLTVRPIDTCMIVSNGKVYGFKLKDRTIATVRDDSFGQQLDLTVNAVQGTSSDPSYNAINFITNNPVSEIRFFNIPVLFPPKTSFTIFFRVSVSTITGVVTTEGALTTNSVTDLPGSTTLTSNNFTLPSLYSNVCGIRIERSGLCCFSNITVYNNLGAALNTGDVRGNGTQSFTVTFNPTVRFQRYSFYSQVPIISWVLKNGVNDVDTVNYNTDSFVYRSLPSIQTTASSVTLECRTAVGYAQISDFRLYNENYGMVSANAQIYYGSALTGPYDLATSYGPFPSLSVNISFQPSVYTFVGVERISGSWLQYTLPIPITVKQCFFYGNHLDYTLAQSVDGSTWTKLASGRGDVYVNTNANVTEAKYFRFICTSGTDTTWNVDVVLCDRFGRRLNAKDGLLSPGGTASNPPTLTYTVDRPVSNVYLRVTNVSNITVNDIQTKLVINSGGYRQFALDEPTSTNPVVLKIQCVDGSQNASINNIQFLGANNDPLIYTTQEMISSIPQGYYEFTPTSVKFPVPVAAKYQVVPGGSMTPINPVVSKTTYDRQYILYDADFNRLSPLGTSNAYLTDVMYSGKATTPEFVQFSNPTTPLISNSYTFTCDPFPIAWTLFGDNDAVLDTKNEIFQTSNVFTGLINNGNGTSSLVYKLRIDALSNTVSNSFQISNFGVYDDAGILNVPRCATNTTTVQTVYGTRLMGYYEGSFFERGATTHQSVVTIRLPCFVRLGSVSVDSIPKNLNIEYSQSQNGTNWEAINPAKLSLFIKIDQRGGTTSELSNLDVRNNIGFQVV